MKIGRRPQRGLPCAELIATLRMTVDPEKICPPALILRRRLPSERSEGHTQNRVDAHRPVGLDDLANGSEKAVAGPCEIGGHRLPNAVRRFDPRVEDRSARAD